MARSINYELNNSSLPKSKRIIVGEPRDIHFVSLPPEGGRAPLRKCHALSTLKMPLKQLVISGPY